MLITDLGCLAIWSDIHSLQSQSQIQTLKLKFLWPAINEVPRWQSQVDKLLNDRIQSRMQNRVEVVNVAVNLGVARFINFNITR